MFSTARLREEQGIARLAGVGFATLVAFAMVLFAAPAASANPIASGSTALTVDKKPAKKLKKNNIKVKRVKPAKVQKGSFVFPVTGGKLKPTDPSTGVIKHSGGLKFKKGKRKLVAKKFVIKVANGVVVAKVGGNNVRLLSVDLSKAKISRNGFGITVKRVGLSLTGAAAKALNKTLKTKAFKKGLRLGHAVVKTQPSTVGLAADGSTDVTADGDTVALLVGAGITPAVIPPATVTPGGDFSFPITGGRTDVKTFAGEIRHSGGISLTQETHGSGDMNVLNLTDFTINIDGEPDLTAIVNGGPRVSILDLDLAGLTVDVDPLDITLGNVAANFSADAATALTDTFGVPNVTGAPLGIATVNAVAN